ncbi:nitrogen fixation protein NifX [Aromatoleum tolulyticum]|uniref:Nitrogen fixation protein NifX n=1 Tax=Aromatoleum tolulyticum TaxID=34027 RepID=A0A1N6SZG7_9RHOO|nr:nitrogen fixation protein NifX [Aromatoleum tolulyticum]SIQ46493.1 nitrogen fixation protein NifX [Aromatoleum tolulyticum]
MKVAFATENLIDVDAHFGWAKKIAIYEVQPDASRLVEVVEFAGDLAEDGTEDKLVPKLDAVRDCAMLYVAAIGGSAAAKVVNLRVHPVKVPSPQPIATIIERLQEVLRGTPPPWLRKVLLKGRERSFDFDAETDVSETEHA